MQSAILRNLHPTLFFFSAILCWWKVFCIGIDDGFCITADYIHDVRLYEGHAIWIVNLVKFCIQNWKPKSSVLVENNKGRKTNTLTWPFGFTESLFILLNIVSFSIDMEMRLLRKGLPINANYSFLIKVF